MNSVSKKRTSANKKPADRRILAKARREEAGERPVTEGITGAMELAALRKLALVAEHVFEAEGLGENLTPVQILSDAVRCARSDLMVICHASLMDSGTIDGMVFRRAELRLDLALALAEYRTEFSGSEEAVAS